MSVLQQKYRAANAGKMVAADHIVCNQGTSVDQLVSNVPQVVMCT